MVIRYVTHVETHSGFTQDYKKCVESHITSLGNIRGLAADLAMTLESQTYPGKYQDIYSIPDSVLSQSDSV